MMTYSAPASRTIAPLTSPVNAPSLSQCRFWPAMPTFEFRAASAPACSRRERRRHDDLDVLDVLDQAAELLDVHDRPRARS